MLWQFLSILPNIDPRDPIEAKFGLITSSADERVATLRKQHPNFDAFLGAFKTTHGRAVSPAVVLRHADAPSQAQTWDAMVGIRNCLSVATIVHQTALVMLYPNRDRILFSDAFEFYPWSLDRDYDHMLSMTPAVWALHQVKDFSGQSAPGAPIHSLRLIEVDEPLLSALLARWDQAYSRQRMSDFDRALFRSLIMANSAMSMPAVQGATIFDYGRQCALWTSAFEILAHFTAGRNRADLPAVLQLLDKKPFLSRSLRPRRYTVKHWRRRISATLPQKLYELLYNVRNAFLHGNPVRVSDLKLAWSGRPILHFAPLLYRCALRNFLDLEFVPATAPITLQDRLDTEMARHDFDEKQVDVEQALRLAKTPPDEDED